MTEMGNYVSGQVKFRNCINSEFVPRPDITAFELAVLLPFFFGEILTEERWEELGERATRHLKKLGGSDERDD